MTAISQQLFIAVRGFLVLLGREDEGELVLFDSGIRASLRSYGVGKIQLRNRTSLARTRSPSLRTLVESRLT